MQQYSFKEFEALKIKDVRYGDLDHEWGRQKVADVLATRAQFAPRKDWEGRQYSQLNDSGIAIEKHDAVEKRDDDTVIPTECGVDNQIHVSGWEKQKKLKRVKKNVTPILMRGLMLMNLDVLLIWRTEFHCVRTQKGMTVCMLRESSGEAYTCHISIPWLLGRR